MGHTLADPDLAYHRLQQRLDRLPTGAPDSPVFQQILRLLFTEQEAEMAAKMPTLCSMPTLSRRTGVPLDELEPMIDRMAAKGLVVDLEHHGERRIILAPVVIGFFEYTFMRVREDAPMEDLAHLFHHYMTDDDTLNRSVFAGSTQLGRSLVREEALPEQPTVEVLDWERATHIVASARSVAVSLCPCRTHVELIGQGCGKPTRTCLTFGGAADALVRSGLAEPISNEEGLEILQLAKSAGLAQTADNVKHGITYMCNCCGCCCGDDAVDPPARDHRIDRVVEPGGPCRPGQVPGLQEVLPRLPGRRHHDGGQPGQGAAQELGDRRPAEVPGLRGV